MSVPPLSNKFDCGSDGTLITVGNTGGACGDAFDLVQTNAGIGPSFSTDFAHSAGLSLKIVTANPVATSNTGRWTGFGSITTSVYSRVYLYLPALPSGSSLKFFRFRTNAGDSAYLEIDTAGKVHALNAAASAIAASQGTTTVAINQWIRIECRVLSSTTVGEIEWRYFSSADSSSITETQSATAQVLGANTDGLIVGTVNTNQPVSYTYYFDDFAVSATDWIGPAVYPAHPSPSAIGFLSRGGS